MPDNELGEELLRGKSCVVVVGRIFNMTRTYVSISEQSLSDQLDVIIVKILQTDRNGYSKIHSMINYLEFFLLKKLHGFFMNRIR